MIHTDQIQVGNLLMFDSNEKRETPRFFIPGVVVSWTHNTITFENGVVKPNTHVSGCNLTERMIEEMGFKQTTVKYPNGNVSVGSLWHKDGFLIRNFGSRFRIKKLNEPHILVIEFRHELENILSGFKSLQVEKSNYDFDAT